MKAASTRFSHLEINVSDYAKSIRFYDKILRPLGWERLSCTTECTAYCDGFMKLILSPAGEGFKERGFHRKQVGLNHLAFYADSRAEVDRFFIEVLKTEGIPILYGQGPEGDDTYYAVLFEDPDRIKIEVVYAPRYCDKEAWPNNLPDDFDPSFSQ